jgi:hypothetical protein
MRPLPGQKPGTLPAQEEAHGRSLTALD